MLLKTDELYPIVGHDGVWIPARLPAGVPVWPTVAPTVRIIVLPTLTWGQRLWLWQYETLTALGWLTVRLLDRTADLLLALDAWLVARMERR